MLDAVEGQQPRLEPLFVGVEIDLEQPRVERGRTAGKPARVQGRSRHYRWREMRAEHWLETGRRNGIADARDIIEALVERAIPATETARERLPRGFPHAVADPILKGLVAAARRAGDELVSSRGG